MGRTPWSLCSPGFALLLKLVYAGRAARYRQRPRRYAEHLVFGAHNHAFTCLALIVAVASPWGPLSAAAMIWLSCYQFRSLKVVYGGHTMGVLLRGLVVALAHFVLFAVVTAALLVVALLVG